MVAARAPTFPTTGVTDTLAATAAPALSRERRTTVPRVAGVTGGPVDRRAVTTGAQAQ